MRRIFDALQDLGGAFLIGLAAVFLGIPAIAIGVVLLVAYIALPVAIGAAASYLLYPLVNPLLMPIMTDDWATAIFIVVAIVIAIFGWSVEWLINDRTDFPFTMLDEAGF